MSVIPCSNCKDSILNQTPTIIKTTTCTGNCPEDSVCIDIVQAKCVSYVGKDDCLQNADNVQGEIDIIRDFVCNLVPADPTYEVKVTSLDTCPGYLADKFTSDSIDITTTTDGSGCQKVNLESVDKYVRVNSTDINTGASPAGGSQYLEDKFIDGGVSVETVTDAPYNNGNPKLKLVNKYKSFYCTPKDTIPQSLERDCSSGTHCIDYTGHYVSCYGSSTKFPTPHGESGSGIPITGINDAGWTESISTYKVADTQPTLVDFERSLPIQGEPYIGGGTLVATNSTFRVPPGTYNIGLSYTLNEYKEVGDSGFGGTGFILFILDSLNTTNGVLNFPNSFDQPYGTALPYYCPIKEVVTCEHESKLTGSTTQSAVTFTEYTYLVLRMVNTIDDGSQTAPLTLSDSSKIVVSFEKIG